MGIRQHADICQIGNKSITKETKSLSRSRYMV